MLTEKQENAQNDQGKTSSRKYVKETGIKCYAIVGPDGREGIDYYVDQKRCQDGIRAVRGKAKKDA